MDKIGVADNRLFEHGDLITFGEVVYLVFGSRQGTLSVRKLSWWSNLLYALRHPIRSVFSNRRMSLKEA